MTSRLGDWSCGGQVESGTVRRVAVQDCVRNEAGRKDGNGVDYEVTNVDVE